MMPLHSKTRSACVEPVHLDELSLCFFLSVCVSNIFYKAEFSYELTKKPNRGYRRKRIVNIPQQYLCPRTISVAVSVSFQCLWR